MKKSIIIALLLLVVPIASAATDIHVEALSGTTVTISILETSDDYNSVQSFYDLPAGDSGNVSATYDGDLDEFDIAVYVKIGGETAYYERFRGFTSGEPIYLQLPERHDAETPSEGESSDLEESDTTSEEKTETSSSGGKSADTDEEDKETSSSLTDDTNATTAGVTGYVTASETGAKNNYTYYIIGAVLLVGLAIASFSIKSRKSSPKQPSNPEASAQKSLPRLSPAPKEDMRSKIEEAERKLREATNDLEKIKKREKIEETEQKLESDRQELERMKADFEQGK